MALFKKLHISQHIGIEQGVGTVKIKVFGDEIRIDLDAPVNNPFQSSRIRLFSEEIIKKIGSVLINRFIELDQVFNVTLSSHFHGEGH